MPDYQLKCEIRSVERFSEDDVSIDLRVNLTRPEGDNDPVTITIRDISEEMDALLKEIELTGSQGDVTLRRGPEYPGSILVMIQETGEAVMCRMPNPEAKKPKPVYARGDQVPDWLTELVLHPPTSPFGWLRLITRLSLKQMLLKLPSQRGKGGSPGFHRWSQIVDVAKGVWSFAKPMLAFAMFGTVVGGSVFTKAFLYPRYKQGVEDAKQVAEIVRTIPMIPVYTKNGPDGETLLTHITIEPLMKNPAKDLTLKSIPVEAVQPEGRLELTRQALVATGDSWNIISNPIIGTFTVGENGIHAQLCQAVRRVMPDPYRLIMMNGESRLGEMDVKYCGLGLGLGEQLELDETFAGYFSFAYLGRGATGVMNFLDRYYDIRDLEDPRLKRAHLIVLAALPDLPYHPTSGKDSECYTEALCWNAIKGRVTDYVLPRMVEEGILRQAEADEIVQELESPELIPKGFYEETLYHERADHAYLGQVRALAQKELLDRCKGGSKSRTERELTCSAWRKDIQRVYMAIDPELQQTVVEASTQSLQDLPLEARATAFVVNGEGEYVAVHSGGQEGWDRLPVEWVDLRLTQEEFPSAVGSLALAVVMAGEGILPLGENQEFVRTDSHHDLLASSERLGIEKSIMYEVVNCYGIWEDSRFNMSYDIEPIQTRWWVPPVNYAVFMQGMLTGEPLPTPHLVTGERLRNGTERDYAFDNVASDECSKLLFQNGLGRFWGSVPLQGTLRGLTPLPDNVRDIIGMTSTVYVSRRNTNAVWAPFAVELTDGSHYMVVTRIHPEKIYVLNDFELDYRIKIGSNLTAADLAVPFSKQILDALGDL